MSKKYFLNYIVFFGLVVVLVLLYQYWWLPSQTIEEEELFESAKTFELTQSMGPDGSIKEPTAPEMEIIVEPEIEIEAEPASGPEPEPEPEPEGPVTDLIIDVLEQGQGKAAKNGDKVSVHYTGALEDGSKFDSSLDRGQPFSFILGVDQMIEGWDQGVLGMKTGEKRKLTVPSHLGYGEAGAPPAIPPNATLIFEVEMLSIE